jgi:hypothetical protein
MQQKSTDELTCQVSPSANLPPPPQVLRSAYLDYAFLARGLQRYSQFLSLAREQPGTFLVPMYDIDLLWHTHCSVSGAYARDCMRLVGRPFDHDDSVGEDRCGLA